MKRTKILIDKCLLPVLISVFLSSSSALADKLYIKINDLSGTGESRYSGVDLEALELLVPTGTKAFYASKIIEHHLPENKENKKMKPESVIGQTVLTDWNASYVFSLNGGYLTAVIDTGSEPITDGWRLTIFEVDGSLFDWGDAPEPYQVSISRSLTSNWEILGLASGTSRFILGENTNHEVNKETLEKIKLALKKKPKNDPVPNDLLEKMQPMQQRLASLNNLAQLKVELAALYVFYNYREHVVNDHKESDNGRVMAPWLLLKTACDRYQTLKKSKKNK